MLFLLVFLKDYFFPPDTFLISIFLYSINMSHEQVTTCHAEQLVSRLAGFTAISSFLLTLN